MASRSPSPAASSSSGLSRASPDPEEEHVYDPAPEVVAEYERVMAERLDTSTLPAPAPVPAPASHPEEAEADTITNEDGSTRPMTKAEKQNAKKKRRKERERLLRLATAAAAGEVIAPEKEEKPVNFRLFSDVRPVALHTKEDYPLTPCPRTRPLSDSARARISQFAEEAARPSIEMPVKQWRRRLGLRATGAGEVCDYEVVTPERLVCDELEVMKGKGTRKVTAYVVEEGGGRVGGGRKRRKVKREFPPPKFWRPEVENGFAYGW